MLMLGAIVVYFAMQPKRYIWYPTYNIESEEPYGLSLFAALLKENGRQDGFKLVSKRLDVVLPKVDAAKTHNYLVVADYFNPDSAEIAAIYGFLQKGNNVFYAVNYEHPYLAFAIVHGLDSLHSLQKELFNEDAYKANYPDSISQKLDEIDYTKRDSVFEVYQAALLEKMNAYSFSDSALFGPKIVLDMADGSNSVPLVYQYRKDSADYLWQRISPIFDKKTEKRATFGKEKLPAFAKLKVGKGQLYLCSTPMLFTNYYLIKKPHFSFASALLSQIPPGDILLDNVKRHNNDLGRNGGNDLSDSPLNFILKHSALAWAWYTLLGAVILFVVVGSKRKQRIIPVVQANHNASLIYAKTLGSLQLKNHDNTAKANEIFNHFLQHLRVKKRWQGKLENDDLRDKLLKIAPDLNREIQTTLYLGLRAQKGETIVDQDVVKLFNYTNTLIART